MNENKVITPESTQAKPATGENAKVIYILYLAGLILGLTGIIGVVMAYVNRDDAPEWLRTHYQFQIRTFWMGLLYLLVGFLLAIVFIGYLVLLFWAIWLIIRCAKGMKWLEQKEAHPNPTGWMF